MTVGTTCAQQSDIIFDFLRVSLRSLEGLVIGLVVRKARRARLALPDDVAGFHEELAEVPEAALPPHSEQGLVEERVVLPQVLFLLIPGERLEFRRLRSKKKLD